MFFTSSQFKYGLRDLVQENLFDLKKSGVESHKMRQIQ
jgi:hypothetical protein